MSLISVSGVNMSKTLVEDVNKHDFFYLFIYLFVCLFFDLIKYSVLTVVI